MILSSIQLKTEVVKNSFRLNQSEKNAISFSSLYFLVLIQKQVILWHV